MQNANGTTLNEYLREHSLSGLFEFKIDSLKGGKKCRECMNDFSVSPDQFFYTLNRVMELKNLL